MNPITHSRTHVITSRILRFFLPWACAGCRGALSSLEDEGFCGRCWLSLRRITGLICSRCGLPLKEGGSLCFRCRTDAPSLRIRAAVEYRGVIPPAIHRFKYGGRKTLMRSFGVLLRSAWDHWPELRASQVLIPVPLHPRNQRQRGYNQAALLAQALSEWSDRPMLDSLLVRSRMTAAQFKLTRVQRLANLHRAFTIQRVIPEDLRTKSFLLIDDICTTGATLQECAKALRRAGARQVQGLVLARD